MESHGEDRIHIQFAVLRIEAQSINGRLLRQNIILALHLQADISLGNLQVQGLIVHGQLHQPQLMLIRQITAAMETELIPFPGGTMSLGDIECRLRVLEQQFQTLLEKATDDPAAYGGQFKEILDEQTFLKEKRSVILANNNEQAKVNQRIMDAAQTLENASPYITEWDESAVRQLVETVKILSKDEVAVTLKGGIEICQKIMY